MPAKKPGRPQGAKNIALDHADGQLTRCRCGSTRRGPYRSKLVREIAGTDAAGKPHTHVIWRKTVCLDCGQHRVDRLTENRPARKK